MTRQTGDYLANLTTEQTNPLSKRLDQMDGFQIAALMNEEDAGLIPAVRQALPQIGQAIEAVSARLQQGGRLLYFGAGTSGRLGVLDASECPPTFSVPATLVQGAIAGGDRALRHAVEGAEDDEAQGMLDARALRLTENDCLVGISASGYCPYCAGALKAAREAQALAISLCCNRGARLSQFADIAIEAPTTAEVLMGSTRLKAGTATKMILNMLSTGVMVRLGRVYQNLMVDVSISNSKLRDRAARILTMALGINKQEAETLLAQAQNSVKTALVMHLKHCDADQANRRLAAAHGHVRRALEEA